MPLELLLVLLTLSTLVWVGAREQCATTGKNVFNSMLVDIHADICAFILSVSMERASGYLAPERDADW